MYIDLYHHNRTIKVQTADGEVIEIPAPQPQIVGLPFLRVQDNHLVIEVAFLDADGIRREELKLTRKHTLNNGKIVEESITDLVGFPLSDEGFDRRVMFRKPYEAGNKPICRSEDGVYPDPEYAGTLNSAMEIVESGLGVNVACATCPFSRWKRIDGRNVRDCDHQLQIPFAILIDDKVFPAAVRFRSSAFKAGKRVVDHIAHLKAHNVQPYNAGVELHVISVNQLLNKQGLAGHVLTVKQIDSSLFINLESGLKRRVVDLYNTYQQSKNHADSES